MGTNYVPLVSIYYCIVMRETFMMSLFDDKQADINVAFRHAFAHF